MLKNYELLYILHPDLESSSDKISEKITGGITKNGGEITNQEDWGKRKLAYKIAKNDFGVYILVNFTLDSELLPKVERDLRLSEEVLRFMVISLPEVEAGKEAKPAKKAARKAPAKAEKEEKVEEPKAEVEVVEEVKEEKPAKKTVKKAEKEEKTVKAEADVVEEKPAKKAKKAEKTEEEERMKKLDEKLDEILGE